MSAPFTPANGERARWRYCYDLVVERTPGDEITYLDVMDALDCDQPVAIAAMLEAKRHLEEDRQRTVRNVRRFGWIVLDAKGNLDESERRIRKSRRAVSRAARVLVATPRDELSRIEQSRYDFQARQVQAARGIYERKSKSFAELEREAQSTAPKSPLSVSRGI